MPDYAKKTVAELTELLKSRSLPHSGKKAELVARLEENDKASAPAEEAAEPAAEEPAPAPVHDELPKVEIPPLKTVVTQDDTPTVPATTQAEEAEAADGEAPAPEDGAGTDTQLAAAIDYSMGLAKSEVDDEMEKRKKRAERFGISAEEVDKDKEKALERAKKFGTGAAESVGVQGLDEALPTERPRKRGRPDDDGNRQGRGGRHKFARSNERRGRRGDRGGERRNGAAGGDRAAFSSNKDREAAEARKKRFTA